MLYIKLTDITFLYKDPAITFLVEYIMNKTHKHPDGEDGGQTVLLMMGPNCVAFKFNSSAPTNENKRKWKKTTGF